MKIIARIHTGFEEKFGIPRQSGLAQTQAEIIFEPPYNIREASEALRNSLTYGYCGIFQSVIKNSKNENGILPSGRRDWAATHG